MKTWSQAWGVIGWSEGAALSLGRVTARRWLWWPRPGKHSLEGSGFQTECMGNQFLTQQVRGGAQNRISTKFLGDAPEATAWEPLY